MTQRKLKSCYIGLISCLIALLIPAAAQAGFGVQELKTTALNKDGTVNLQAGSHPYEFNVAFTMNQDPEEVPEGTLRDLIVDLPPGFGGNPRATPRCLTAEFEGQVSLCPGRTQIGIARIAVVGLGTVIQPLYNLTPPLGVVARFGFSLTSLNSFEEASLNPANNYGVRVSDLTVPAVPGSLEIQSVEQVVWGVPADPEHDAERTCVIKGKLVLGCSTDSPELPFISLPTNCTTVPQTRLQVDSLEEPGLFKEATAFFEDEEGNPAHLQGCEALPFSPKLSAAAETNQADSPTGLEVSVEVPQDEAPKQRAAAHLKDVSVAFPAGLAVNASAADGLAACPLSGPEGINLPGSGEPLEGQPAKCPAASKIGTVEVSTPVLDHTVPGSVYLGRQKENPFGSLIALYIALDDPISGVVAKIAGKVEPDPLTGQLKGTFENNPQLPFEELHFNIFGGSRASLTTPLTCGTYKTAATMTPWSAPEGKAVSSSSAFNVSAAPGGGPCAPTEAAAPNNPSFEAGTATPLAGAYSPFVMKLSRANGSQHISGLNLTLPKGVSAKFAGLTECSEGQIAAAPSCPASSELGTVNVGAGSGAPLYVQGHAYLAGPYKGAPFSVAVITPAIAGPFDLGVVVVRSALYVDEETAQGTIKTDPLPTSLHGIPLGIRSVAIHVDRDQFTLNPTSCEAGAVSGQAISTTGAIAPLSNRFQVGGCKALDFSPKISLRFKGGTKRAQHPALRTVVTRPEGQANFGKVSVTLPSTQFIDQNHVGNPCTRPKFAEGKCPPISELGTVKAFTPLLDQPLSGKLYFRANGGARTLPDVVADLNGRVHFVLVGFLDSIHKKGSEQSRVRITFAQNPDAPVSKVVIESFGGKRGAIVNSQNLCKTKVPQTAIVKMEGQNGKPHNSQPKIANSCPKPKRR